MPDGWELVPESIDIVANVVGNNWWGTNVVVLDGTMNGFGGMPINYKGIGFNTQQPAAGHPGDLHAWDAHNHGLQWDSDQLVQNGTQFKASH